MLMHHCKTGRIYRAVDVGTFCKLTRVLTAFFGANLCVYRAAGDAACEPIS